MIPVAARRKIMLAASLVDAGSPREAAIVGAACTNIIATGRCNPVWVAQTAADTLRAWNLVGVSKVMPGPTETHMVLDRFAAVYGRPLVN
jgi:hypothetical protein